MWTELAPLPVLRWSEEQLKKETALLDRQYRGALINELEELCDLAEHAAAHMPAIAPAVSTWMRDSRLRVLGQGANHFAAERELERITLQLRRICLRAAHEVSEKHFRSPTAAEMADPQIDLGGYERSFAPVDAEERLREAGGEGEMLDHIVFSSGQAALVAALTVGAQLRRDPGKILEVLHIGGYFETGALLRSFSAAGFCRQRGGTGFAGNHTDLVIAEPVFHDPAGAFHLCDTTALLASLDPNSLLILDATLLGPEPRLYDRYPALRGNQLHVVLRSGLKLDQAGLELANVGILSIHGQADAATSFDDFRTEARKFRALNGTSLSFAAETALSFPWCLDPARGRRFAARIFANNRLFAETIEAGGWFSHVSHPAAGATAPFVILRLREDNPQAYRRFADWLAGRLTQERILMERGGSFGFRGHRFDIVLPEDNSPPFIRIAMGYRGGWSRDRIIDFFARMGRGDVRQSF